MNGKMNAQVVRRVGYHTHNAVLLATVFFRIPNEGLLMSKDTEEAFKIHKTYCFLPWQTYSFQFRSRST